MSHFQNIQLENYRNFINFKSNFIPGCNVLIGNNGSGKTNILESLLDRLSPKKQYVNIADSIIPLPENCWCGPKFKDNEYYIKSVENESKY